MNRRESTNVKLAAIINSKAEDDDKETDILKVEEKARNKLRRASLYGGGARAIIPRVKKTKKKDQSPFTLSSSGSDLRDPKAVASSVPPGAHTDLFRIVT